MIAKVVFRDLYLFYTYSITEDLQGTYGDSEIPQQAPVACK